MTFLPFVIVGSTVQLILKSSSSNSTWLLSEEKTMENQKICFESIRTHAYRCHLFLWIIEQRTSVALYENASKGSQQSWPIYLFQVVYFARRSINLHSSYIVKTPLCDEPFLRRHLSNYLEGNVFLFRHNYHHFSVCTVSGNVSN